MSVDFSKINIADYDYSLPEERIALYPLQERDKSKLIVYSDGKIQDSVFCNLDQHLPCDTLLILNDTKVIHARLLFRKESGARIEIFCLEPYGKHREIQLAMQQKKCCEWKCLVGNAKKWKQGVLKLKIESSQTLIVLFAEIVKREQDAFIIKFSWSPEEYTFSEIIELAGNVPLPPYINRATEPEDNVRYQTVFANTNGSVAAPTAGLHFTDELFRRLEKKNINPSFLTLHVGAGTFKPVSENDISKHIMHSENVVVKKSFLEKILTHKGKCVAVGTTSVRTLESIFVLGSILTNTGLLPSHIGQWEAYDESVVKNDKTVVLQRVLHYLEKNNKNEIAFSTSLMILPGYKFRMIDGLITNFHQPRSTLLLLVAAFIGDVWKDIYRHALDNNYRFLSYGDACLFLK